MKLAQKKLLLFLNDIYKENKCSYGFERGKNHILNANIHKKKKFLLNIDLKDMFNQITYNRIYGMLIKEPYLLNKDVAKGIATLSCYKYVLPQGAPTSPIISNMILKMLDTKLILYAKKYNLYYTRYADDITFSSNINFSNIVFDNYPYSFNLNEELLSIFKKANFTINNAKTKYISYYRRQEVTGIIINKKLNIRKEKRKEIRAYLFFCKKYGILNSAKKYFENKKGSILKLPEEKICKKFEEVLHGKINYLVDVKGDFDIVSIKYREEFNNIFHGGFNLERIKTAKSLLQNFTFPIESNNNTGTGFIMKNIGIITAYHVVFDYEKNIYENLGIIYCDKKYPINQYDIIKSDPSFDYVIIDKKVINSEEQGLEYDVGFELNDKVSFGGFPDYVSGNKITLDSGKIICKSQKTVVGFVATIDATLFHGMSGAPILNEKLKVIGYALTGTEMNEYYKTNKNNYVSGFRPIENIIN